MSVTTTKPSRIMEILEKETHGHSFKSHKYSLDESERSAVEYGEKDAVFSFHKDYSSPLSLPLALSS